MSLQQALTDIGLHEREVKIYLATLELGESTVLPIAKKAGIKRTYCYDILSSLSQKGLVSFVEKNNRRRYSAEDPKKIHLLFRNRLQNLFDVLPELTSIYNKASGKPKVRFYDGVAEITAIYEQLVNITKLDTIGSPNHIEKYLGEYLKKSIGKIVTERLRIRELIPQDSNFVFYHKYYKKPYHQIRRFPKSVKLTTDMMLYENKLVLVSYGNNLHAVVIEDSNIVDTQKALFEILWNNTKKSF